ncbi:MAG: hypothetical protein EBZ77_02380 [Chitinophagia bacterium]|nr:hypothetical protein [Chitinophagia bacterium]
MAQVRGGDNYYASKMIVDINIPVGVVMQKPTYSFNANYPDVALQDIGTLKMGAGLSYGIDAEFGYFFGKRRKFGIGGGINYMMQNVDLTLDKFRVDYKAYDKQDYVYRQVVRSARNSSITEKLKITNINIPIALKYKKRFSTRIGVTADLGIMYNVAMKNDWSTNGKFDYEAIYAFDSTTNYSNTYYDKGATPDTKDWLITYDMYDRTHTMLSVEGYFDSLRSRGKEVALGVKPTGTSGSINYTTGSIGFFFRPAVNIRCNKHIHFNVGAYFAYQSFNNKSVDNYRLIDNMGTKYSSMLNTVTNVTSTTIGINLGVRYFIGTPKDSDYDGLYDE